MLFSSMTFLFLFLPVTCMVYFVIPEKGKNAALLVSSLFFYFWGEPQYSVLLVFEILLAYGAARGIYYFDAKQKTKKNDRRVQGCLLATAIIVLLALLFIFKYTDFLIGTWNELIGADYRFKYIALPLGISFYTFQMISYLIDVYRGDQKPEENLVDFAAYAAMFPQLVAGPIVRYADVRPELKKKVISLERVSLGVTRFVMGLSKKLLLADLLGELVLKLQDIQPLGFAGQWVMAVSYMLQVYYDFSGYSDMAIGLGKMLGFYFPENFNYPFLAKSVTEFWQRWHMTLGGWFRDYLYIPLGGNRVSFFRFCLNVLIVWSLSGLWHGASWNFVLWGVYFGGLLIAEKMTTKLWRHRKKGYGHLITLFLLCISFVIFRQENPERLKQELSIMLTFSKPLRTLPAAWYQIRSYAAILAIAVISATPYPMEIVSRFQRAQRLRPFTVAILLLLCIAFLLGNTSHPFLYFRF